MPVNGPLANGTEGEEDDDEVAVAENVLNTSEEGTSDSCGSQACSHDDNESAPFFKDGPPLYIQRYEYVLNLLGDERWRRDLRRLVDVGANNCAFLYRLRNSCGMRYFREIIALDVDEYLLTMSGYKTVPLNVSSFVKEHLRPFFPLDVYCMVGSISDKDDRLKNMDVVVAIEVIEHLEPETLKQLPDVVFGHMRPKIAVFTTPNRDFNVLFPNFRGPFRHWDHKFEFSRQEFKDWAEEIVQRFPDYELKLDGVGEAPSSVIEDRDYGHCSQIAIFTRLDFQCRANNGEYAHRELASHLEENITLVENGAEGGGIYKIVRHNHHPSRPDERSMEERAYDAVCSELLGIHKSLVEEDRPSSQDPPKIHCDRLREVLERCCFDDYGDSYSISDDQLGEIVETVGDGFSVGKDDLGVFFTVDEDYWFRESTSEYSDDAERLDFDGDGDRPVAREPSEERELQSEELWTDTD